MAMASSSTTTQTPPRHPLLFPAHGTTAAPPPTPSSHPPNLLPSTASTAASDQAASITADTLASLLNRLPTTLSLPPSRFARRRSSSPSSTNTTAKAAVPIVSISDQNPDTISAIAAAASDHGFFQLTDHQLNSQLAEAAESDSASLFALTLDEKRRLFPMNWPAGFDENNDDDDEEPTSLQNASFCLADHHRLSTELGMASLAELTRELEALALKVVELIACALGFENPFSQTGSVKPGPLMWVSKSENSGKTRTSGSIRCYPYAAGLKYQIRSKEYRLETDTGPVLVKPEVGSVLVTLGDIVQVWSNGKTKKVRGQPIPIQVTSDEEENSSISMTLLMSLPLDTTISPLLSCNERTTPKFHTIPFEDYAWRVYHQSLFFKDTLHTYRVFED